MKQAPDNSPFSRTISLLSWILRPHRREPGGTPDEHPHVELAHIQIGAVDVGDLLFAPGGGFEALGDIDDTVVLEVDPRDGVRRLRFGRLLLDRERLRQTPDTSAGQRERFNSGS